MTVLSEFLENTFSLKKKIINFLINVVEYSKKIAV